MIKSYIKFTDEDINFKVKIFLNEVKFSNYHEPQSNTTLIRLMEPKLHDSEFKNIHKFTRNYLKQFNEKLTYFFLTKIISL